MYNKNNNYTHTCTCTVHCTTNWKIIDTTRRIVNTCIMYNYVHVHSFDCQSHDTIMSPLTNHTTLLTNQCEALFKYTQVIHVN